MCECLEYEDGMWLCAVCKDMWLEHLALSTPREPKVDENLGDEIRGALRLTDKLRRWIIREVGVESGIDAIDLTSHLRAHLDSAACIVLYSDRSPSPYTDEDGREEGEDGQHG